MREAADSLISNGMADVGYQYVDIDDCWSNVEKSNDKKRIGPRRDVNGNVLPNVNFPDMKGMNDYIHSKGLKTGIYSSPGPLTCAVPLVYSGQLNKMNAFTLNVLCNPEVIDVNQDALGKPGRVITKSDESFIMIKDLEDGSKAVGLCNSGEIPLNVTFIFSEAGLSGKQIIRNLWKQKEIGSFRDRFTAIVPRHGVVLVRVIEAKKEVKIK